MRRRYSFYALLLGIGLMLLGGMTLSNTPVSAHFPSQLIAGAPGYLAPPPPAQSAKPQVIARNPAPQSPVGRDQINSILYSQYDNGNGFGTSSQNFEPVNDALDDQTADDFVVPSGNTWNISEIDAAGFLRCVTCPVASSINITFSTNVVSGTYSVPGTVIASRPNMAYTTNGGSGNYNVQITPQVTLPPGIYWVTVQPNLDLGPGPPTAPVQQWFWLDRTVQAFNGAAWRNPGGGFGVACTNWDRRTFCTGDAGAPDQMFAIGGERQGQPTGTATPTPNGIPTATPTACPLVTQVTGAIDTSDPIQTGRLGRNGVASTCSVPKTCPGAFNTTPLHYDSYTFTNSSGSPQCYTVTLNAACPLATNPILSAAYLGSYDPNNLCTNYLADAGASAASVQYSFTVPAGATFVVVVTEIVQNAGCSSYTLTLNACTITCSRTLTWHLTYQGLVQPDPGNVQPVTVQLQAQPSGPTTSFTTIPDQNGNFTLNVNSLPAGTYNWWLKSPRYLATSGTLTISAACTSTFDFGQQRAGDVNDDNCVDVTDFSQLRSSFGRSCGDAGFNGNADYNNDCIVDVTDFSLQRSNFGQCGPSPFVPLRHVGTGSK